jgi:hypothetical protein
MATAFLLSSDLYFLTTKLQTASIKILGFDGVLFPVRILESKEES